MAVGLSLSFDKVAYIHQTNDTAWFNLSVKFPFHHGKDTVKYTNETTPPNIEFGNDVEICSWLFMAINAFWFIMAFGIFLAYILVHGGEQMERAATVVRLQFLTCYTLILFTFMVFCYCMLFLMGL